MKEKNLSEVLNIYESVSEKILSGEYPAGYRLVESDLASAFGVSRTPVRLAIERLVSEGLACHIPHKGAIVRQMSIEDIRSLLAVREVNEGLAARLASQNVTDADSDAMNDILRRMEEALASDDLQGYYALCGEIHKYIMELAHNEFLSEFINKIYNITYRYHINAMINRPSSSLKEHRRIVDAILSRDGNLAEKTMKQHVKKVSDFYNDERNAQFFRSLAQLGWRN